MALFFGAPGLSLPYLNAGTRNSIVRSRLANRGTGEGDAMQTRGNRRGIMGLVERRGGGVRAVVGIGGMPGAVERWGVSRAANGSWGTRDASISK